MAKTSTNEQVFSLTLSHGQLHVERLTQLWEQTLSAFIPTLSRVLIIIPDFKRSAPLPSILPPLIQKAQAKGAKVDCIVALGTHRPLSIEERNSLTGGPFDQVEIFNHQWQEPAALCSLGRVQDVEIVVNKRILDYDQLLVVGPVFPHEVVGFSGGAKYFFPGLAGAEIIDHSHWMGALETNRKVLGHKDTAIRRLIEEAATLIEKPVTYVNLVMEDKELRGLFVGQEKRAWSEAADLSASLNISYHAEPYERVLSMPSARYEDLWTAAKAIYKVESIVADGGELIVYAPNLKELSFAHGEHLRKVGYHVRDYFLAQEERFAAVPKRVLAHSTHVRGDGSYLDGVEHGRIKVTLATAIDEATCLRLGLTYRDPAAIDVQNWRGQKGSLIVERAGEVAHLLRD